MLFVLFLKTLTHDFFAHSASRAPGAPRAPRAPGAPVAPGAVIASISSRPWRTSKNPSYAAALRAPRRFSYVEYSCNKISYTVRPCFFTKLNCLIVYLLGWFSFFVNKARKYSWIVPKHWPMDIWKECLIKKLVLLEQQLYYFKAFHSHSLVLSKNSLFYCHLMWKFPSVKNAQCTLNE